MKRLVESTINFPREKLDQSVWKEEDGNYTLKPEAKETILRYIDSYPGFDLNDLIEELHIVGSICTNLYSDDADIDVHIIPKKEKLPDDPEKLVQDVKNWSHQNPVYIGQHPVELYIQLLPQQEMIGDAVYDVLNDEWLKGPKLVNLDYNPYEVYANVLDKVRDYAEQADIDLGELERDVVDFDTLKKAMERLPAGYKEKLDDDLQAKLREIEDDIDKLLKDKKEWVELRHQSSRPSPEQALKDVEIARKWNDANAIFKLLDRYGYIKVISELEKLMNDDKLSTEEVEIIKSILSKS